MPLAQPLETLRKELETQLVEDLAAALKSLQVLLPEKSEKYGLVIVLLGRLNDANEARIRDTLADDELQRKYNRIRADLLNLVQGLEESDFDPALSLQQRLKPAYRISGGKVIFLPNTKGYRLPTEAEWEYAARGGRRSRGYEYSGGDDVYELAWFKDNSKGKPHKVGTQKRVTN